MEYSFPRYLLSKQTVDDRALNKDVVHALRLHIPARPVSVIEVGAGIGTMLKRLIEWNIFCNGKYILVDSMPENIDAAQAWIPEWAAEAGLDVEVNGHEQIHLCDRTRDIRIQLECTDVFDFIQGNKTSADLLIAHAFLDLLHMPESLGKVLSLTNGLAWLTINFDGMTSFQPVIDPVLDEQIEMLYHASMDTRPAGGNSRMGRKLFEYLRLAKAEILAAGASDWVVYATDGSYPAAEKYFLHYIMHFFEASLKDCEEIDGETLKAWLMKRHEQIECGELVYIAHQMDFLIRSKS